MAYQSLYRKYRPQTFADVVGQGHVTRTIQNALIGGRVAHGYLFTGTRGTAKTTVARLLAKALNCQSAAAPTPEPCNRCEACISITGGSCIDVVEMDAASHRGVADIEDVRKSVGYGPMEMRFKVFIIDEAHQLSSDAKDAFLKTLEEPPANVVFILATTEPQAIPITIRSRCQQFDFKRGSLREIASRLRYVLDCEGVGYTEAAVSLIARGAEGSYRDSLSLLEQVLAYSPERIEPSDVDAVLGTLDATMLGRVTDAIARKDAPAAFALAGQLLDAGKEARTLLRTLSAHFRDLLLVTVGGPAVAQEMTADEAHLLQQEQRACRFSPQMLLRAMETLNEAQGETRWNNQHRLLVELTFLKLMTLDAPATPTGASSFVAVSFATAPIVFAPESESPPIAPTSRAPAASLTPAPAVPRTAAPAIPPAEPVVNTPLPEPAAGLPTTAPAPGPRPPAAAPPPDVAEPLLAGFFADDDRADAEDEEEYGVDDQTPSLFDGDFGAVASMPPPAASASTVSSGVSVQETSEPEAVLVPEEAEETDFPQDGGDDEEEEDDDYSVPVASMTAVPVTVPAPAPVELPATPVPEEPDDGTRLDINRVMRAWPHFLQEAQKISKQTEVMMSQAAVPIEAHGKTVTLAFSARMNYDRMNEPRKLEFVRKLLARCLDVPSVTVRFVLDENAPVAPARSRTGDKRAVKRDPIAALAELDSASGFAAPPMPDDEAGWSVMAPVSIAAPVGAAPPVRATAEASAPRAAAVTSQPNTSGVQESDEAAFPRQRRQSEPQPGISPTEVRADRWRSDMLDNALVQETLQVFGGEIVEE